MFGIVVFSSVNHKLLGHRVWIAVGLWCFEFIGCLSKFSVCYTGMVHTFGQVLFFIERLFLCFYIGTMWYFRRLSHEYYAKSWTHPVFLNNHLEKSAVTPSLVSLYIGLMNHAGSFAKGALAFCLTRPCRLFNAWVSPGYFSLYPRTLPPRRPAHALSCAAA